VAAVATTTPNTEIRLRNIPPRVGAATNGNLAAGQLVHRDHRRHRPVRVHREVDQRVPLDPGSIGPTKDVRSLWAWGTACSGHRLPSGRAGLAHPTWASPALVSLVAVACPVSRRNQVLRRLQELAWTSPFEEAYETIRSAGDRGAPCPISSCHRGEQCQQLKWFAYRRVPSVESHQRRNHSCSLGIAWSTLRP
jgi:hypothetical protein